MAVTITKDMTGLMKKAVRAMQKTEVLVGIPDENAERKPLNGKQPDITNAAIGYISEFGSPEQNIPARPSLIPGIESIRPAIVIGLRAAAQQALSGHVHAVEDALIAVGLKGVSAVQKQITAGGYAPLAPATIANRFRQRGTKSIRSGETSYIKMIASGMSPQEAQGAAGINPLMNTDQFIKSFTSVLHEKGKD